MTAGETPSPARKSPKPDRFSGRSERFGTVPFALTPHQSPHGQVTAVSMMKDEGPFVIEWIAHQIALGFTDIVVYTNDCSDGTDDMLIRLEELGLAHHRRNDIPEGLRPQPSALNYAQDEPVVQASDWLMVFDADEFLAIRYGDGTLDDLIGAAKERGANGIVVTWRIFGSGGVVEWSRAPVTEQYLRAAPMEWNRGWGVKTLFAFDDEYWKLGIHRPKMRNKWLDTEFPHQVHWLNGSGKPMEDYFKFRGWRSIVRTIGYDWVQLNHYAVKSVDSYAIRKLRGNVNFKKDKYNSDYWALQDRNETADETQLRYHARRGEIIAALLTDPVLRGLHFAAVERAEARLAEIKAGDDYRQLLADLAAASARPLEEVVAKPPKARDKERIARRMSEVEKRLSEGARAARKSAAAPDQPIPDATYLTLLPHALDPVPLAWHENHGILLPADSRIFTPSALRAIAAGKFERGLARRLPQILPEGARLLHLGAGAGFLPAHLAKVRPDLSIAAQEDTPALAATMTALLARNGIAPVGRLRQLDSAVSRRPEGAAAEALCALVAGETPDVLLLSHPALMPAALSALVAGTIPLPPTVILLGRTFEQLWTDLPAVGALFAEAGYLPLESLDPRLGLGLTLDPGDMGDTGEDDEAD